MGTGMPLTTKCPKCMRGKHGFPKRIVGVSRTSGIAQREEKRYGHRRVGGVVKTLTHMTCGDCGHVWWTTLEAKDRGT
jgi:hypothetical protein